jgi:hypothetical protein
MAISGSWTLHYSWGNTSSYASTPITFNPDGSFTGPATGNWRQKAGTIMLTFDGGPAKYGGTVNGSIGSGAMSTFAGLDGYWYLSKDGTTGVVPQQAVGGGEDQPATADGCSLTLSGSGSSATNGNGSSAGTGYRETVGMEVFR